MLLLITDLNLDDEQMLAFSIDHLEFYLRCFGLSQKEKIEFARKKRDSFYQEFHIDGQGKIAFRKKFEQSHDISHKFNLYDSKFSTSIRMFKEIRSEMKSCTIEITDLFKEKTFVYQSILPSLIHMSINRLYRDDQRLFETLSYDFLTRKQNSI